MQLLQDMKEGRLGVGRGGAPQPVQVQASCISPVVHIYFRLN